MATPRRPTCARERPGLAAGVVSAWWRPTCLAGFRVEAISRPFRDTAGPAVAREPLAAPTRLKHAVGLLGRSVALRAGAPAD